MTRTRATIAAAGLAAVVATCAVFVGRRTGAATTRDPVEAVRAELRAEVEALDTSLIALEKAPTSRTAFRSARDRYKRLEGPLEFYAPALAAAFNSRRQEVDDDDAPPPSTLFPQGFPALETLIFSSERVDADSARRIVGHMRGLVDRARAFLPALHPTSSQIVELSRLEIARVSSLGIAGFDSPVAHASASEGASALEGLATLIDASRGLWPTLDRDRQSGSSRLRIAAEQLRRDNAFATFDRLTFIVAYANPAATALDSLRIASHTTPIRIPRAWRADAPSIYSRDAFSTSAYTPTTSPAQSAALIAEGNVCFSTRAYRPAGHGVVPPAIGRITPSLMPSRASAISRIPIDSSRATRRRSSTPGSNPRNSPTSAPRASRIRSSKSCAVRARWVAPQRRSRNGRPSRRTCDR